jgi:hypothetical protein
MCIRLYRAVKTEQPTRDDFLSSQAKGRPPINNDPDVLRTHDGISMFTPLEIARERARRFRRIGRFLAEMMIPDNSPSIRYQRTFASEGHYTVWGDPDELLALVVSVVPVEPTGKDERHDV